MDWEYLMYTLLSLMGILLLLGAIIFQLSLVVYIALSIHSMF